MASGNASLRK